MSNRKPVILKSMPMILKTNLIVNKNMKPINIKQIKPISNEVTIFDSEDVKFIKENFKKVTIVNKQNVLNNHSRTVAKIINSNGELIERNSDSIVKLLGEDNYDVLLMALCSVISQELRIRGIMSLLTEKDNSTGLSMENLEKKNIKMKIDSCCQTDESRIVKNNQKRGKRQLTPYVIKDLNILPSPSPPKQIKKVIIHPDDYNNATKPQETKKKELNTPQNTDILSNTTEISQNTNHIGIIEPLKNVDVSDLPVDENTNDSITSSWFSMRTSTDLHNEPYKILIDSHTESKMEIKVENQCESAINYFKMIITDGREIFLPYKDVFHIASKENLMKLDMANQNLLWKYQMSIDLTHCLTKLDGDGNLPLHMAVMEDDLHLLKRQCIVLQMKNESVDIPANGLRALKMSLFQESTAFTSVLLEHGADPLIPDEDHLTCVHAAAELDTDHLSVVLAYCRTNARKILSNHSELCYVGWEESANDQLASYLLDKICSMADKRGHTPLMVCCARGLYPHARALAECGPRAVDARMPNTGSTALYLAVTAACDSIPESCNTNKLLDKYRMTIDTLLEHGANPNIENHAGFNVNTLLMEYNCTELCMLIANKVTFSNFFDKQPQAKNFDNFILIKDDKGTYIKEMTKKPAKKTTKVNQKAKSDTVKPKATKTSNKNALSETDKNVKVARKTDTSNPTSNEAETSVTNKPKIILKTDTDKPVLTDKNVTSKPKIVFKADIKTRPSNSAINDDTVISKKNINVTNKPIVVENIVIKPPIANLTDTKKKIVINNLINKDKIVVSPKKRLLNVLDSKIVIKKNK